MSPGRPVRYVLRMFPPVLAGLGALAFASIWFGLQALAGPGPLRLGIHGAVGVVTVPLWMLLVRLLDDLHDAPEDLRLALAGDPRYRDRPIVIGTITPAEIRGLVVVVGAAMLMLNLLPASPSMALAGPVGLALTWLGFQWFFIPALARNPGPAAYLIRKSLALLIGVYTVVAFRDQWPDGIVGAATLPLLLAPVLEVAAWETARKIRLPEDETSYPTYSRLFGLRRAALVPAGFAVLAAGCLFAVAVSADLGTGYRVLLIGAATIVVSAGVVLRMAPTRNRARLEPVALAFAALAHGGMVAALVLRHGLAAT